jgi:hypothetical protein
LFFSLTQTNIEEKILTQSPHIITNEGGQVSYKEFARRLEVPSTSDVLQQLFRMYDKVIITVLSSACFYSVLLSSDKQTLVQCTDMA